jgi:hypothetical protein
MARVLSLSILAVLFSAMLRAQDDPSSTPAPDVEPVIVEMKIQRSLAADSSGVADTLDSVAADKLILHYELQNLSDRDVRITGEARVSDQVNCAVAIVRQPESTVAAQGSAGMVIEIRPGKSGPLSFTVNMGVDEQAYTFAVQSKVTAVLDHEYHCHWWGCHEHDDHHHHCSTGEGGSGLLLGAVATVLAGLLIRRRLA